MGLRQENSLFQIGTRFGTKCWYLVAQWQKGFIWILLQDNSFIVLVILGRPYRGLRVWLGTVLSCSGGILNQYRLINHIYGSLLELGGHLASSWGKSVRLLLINFFLWVYQLPFPAGGRIWSRWRHTCHFTLRFIIFELRTPLVY